LNILLTKDICCFGTCAFKISVLTACGMTTMFYEFYDMRTVLITTIVSVWFVEIVINMCEYAALLEILCFFFSSVN
jgi:hypothetical protein